jgi:hypothetical protein
LIFFLATHYLHRQAMPRKAAKEKAEPAPRRSTANKSKVSKVGQDVANGTLAPAPKVIAFYSDRVGQRYREFSNFYSDSPAYVFNLPPCAQREGLPQSFMVEFSEKAIMLAKAAMMGDEEILQEIALARSPKDCKALGRAVRNFDQELWASHLEELAFEVVKQKFEASPELRKVLLSTGDKILAEAAPNDSIWGIGLSLKDDRAYDQSQWCGRNVLGFALMRARSYLRGEAVPCGYGGDAAASEAATLDEALAAAPSHQEGNSTLDSIEIDPAEDFLRPISDLEAVKRCYDRYGVVGVTGVLSQEECHTLLTDGLQPFLPEGCSLDDVDTFPLADRAVNRYGVIGKEALFNSTILGARLHPNVAAAYAAVHGREDVFACHDRAAWMRPAAFNSAWSTPFSWPGLHFDISLANYFGGSRSSVDDFLCEVDYSGGHWAAENNAKHESMGRTVQGVLNLYDNEEEDGGFHCVPGVFGQPLQQWVQEHPGLPKAEPNGKYELKGFGVDAQLGAQSVRVPCPAGTLILFDATLPHGTKPNVSARSRAILFLRYITSDELPAHAWQKRNAALRRLAEHHNFEPDGEQEKHMYGPE